MARLRRNRILLLGALLLLGCAAGVAVSLLRPDGFIQSHPEWRSQAPGAGSEWQRPPDFYVEGYGAGTRGGTCGLRLYSSWSGQVLRSVPLRGCYSYHAPSVTTRAGSTFVVWEHRDEEVAVSRLDRLDVEAMEPRNTLFVERPRTASGVLSPRTDVSWSGSRLLIEYRGGQVVSVRPPSRLWPGGLLEVARARIGPRAGKLLSGIVGLLMVCLLAAARTFRLPGSLARARASNRCLEVQLPTHGNSVVVADRPVALDLSDAHLWGARGLHTLGGTTATLVVEEPAHGRNTYRDEERVVVLQIWAGPFAEAVARARAVRTGAIGLTMLAAAVLLFGLSAYLAL